MNNSLTLVVCYNCFNYQLKFVSYVDQLINMFKFGGNTMSSKCNMQHVVSLSIIVAEFIVVIKAIKDERWMKEWSQSYE